MRGTLARQTSVVCWAELGCAACTTYSYCLGCTTHIPLYFSSALTHLISQGDDNTSTPEFTPSLIHSISKKARKMWSVKPQGKSIRSRCGPRFLNFPVVSVIYLSTPPVPSQRHTRSLTPFPSLPIPSLLHPSIHPFTMYYVHLISHDPHPIILLHCKPTSSKAVSHRIGAQSSPTRSIPRHATPRHDSALVWWVGRYTDSTVVNQSSHDGADEPVQTAEITRTRLSQLG